MSKTRMTDTGRGEQLAPVVQLPYSTSSQDSWSDADTRRMGGKPREVCEINSDSPRKIVSEKGAGNRPCQQHTGIIMG